MEKKISRQASAAKMIRQFMKENDIAGRVRSQGYSMGSSINIDVENLIPAQYEILKSYSRQFEYGSFNGMEDIYEYNNVNDDIPQVTYVFVNNRMSDELGENIYQFIKGYYAGMEGAPASFKEAHSFYNQNFNGYASHLVFQLFAGGYMRNQYWESIGAIVPELEVA
jgi:hypothetical protein